MISINSNTLVEDYDYIWSNDPALDRSSEDFAEKYAAYSDTGDSSLLPFLGDQKPVLWRMRHLRGRARKQLTDAMAVNNWQPNLEVLFDACALTLVSVSGLKNDDGTPCRIDHVTTGKISRVSDNDMMALDEAFPGLVEAIGTRAITKAAPGPKS